MLKLIGMDEHLENHDNIRELTYLSKYVSRNSGRFVLSNEWHLRVANHKYGSMNIIYRKLITKFGCSDHRIEIEIGRHRKIPMNQRESVG